jgi:hypothetical protein
MEFYSATNKNEILSFASKWMERENIIWSKIRPKITCSPSYSDYRPKTNAAILLDTGHTKRRPCTGGIRQGKETRNLDMTDVPTV